MRTEAKSKEYGKTAFYAFLASELMLLPGSLVERYVGFDGVGFGLMALLAPMIITGMVLRIAALFNFVMWILTGAGRLARWSMGLGERIDGWLRK